MWDFAFAQFPQPSNSIVPVFSFDSEDKCSEWRMLLHAFRIFFFNLLQGSSWAWLQSMGGCVSYGMRALQEGFEEIKDFTQQWKLITVLSKSSPPRYLLDMKKATI